MERSARSRSPSLEGNKGGPSSAFDLNSVLPHFAIAGDTGSSKTPAMKTNIYPVGRCGWAAGVGALCALLSAGLLPLRAQDAESGVDAEAAQDAAYAAEIAKITWQTEGKGKIGSLAEIDIPSGYRFADGEGASQLLQIWGNPASPSELGVIANEKVDWAVFFDFEDSGYVKDDEKDELDADKIMKDMRSTEDGMNEARREQGLEALHYDGWAKEPFYNETTHNLEWGILLRSESGNVSVNYFSKVLGRGGVMNAVLLCSPDEMEAVLPTYRSLLTGYSYVEGKAYADYKSGDKVAKAGLTALIVGGSAVVAGKLGLFAVLAKFFAKAWKLVVVGVVAVGVGIKKMFSRGSGRLEES